MAETNPLDSVRNFLLDMDGTLYLGDRLFEGTRPFLDRLEATGRQRLYLTNNSSRSTEEYVAKLKKMQIDASPEEVFTSGEATLIYLSEKTDYQRVFLLGTPGLEKQFREWNFELNAPQPDVVVLGFDMTLTYEKLRQASRFLLSGVPFVATHPDFVCPTEELPIPDCGSMIALLKAATGVEPKVIGKPNAEMVESALSKLGAKVEQTAIVGDRLYTDIEMGFRSGLKTIIVLSGETKAEDLKHSPRQPDMVVESVSDLIELLR